MEVEETGRRSVRDGDVGRRGYSATGIVGDGGREDDLVGTRTDAKTLGLKGTLLKDRSEHVVVKTSGVTYLTVGLRNVLIYSLSTDRIERDEDTRPKTKVSPGLTFWIPWGPQYPYYTNTSPQPVGKVPVH